MTTVYDFSAQSLDGTERNLADYRGRVLLVVNTASQCGFTPQYEGLESLFRRYSGQGLVVLGFPCDQFGHQEPGDAQQIRQFCSTTYDVTFPMFAKVKVNGDQAHPLYRWLRAEHRGVLTGAIKWNFTKFLTDTGGRVVNRYAPSTPPAKISDDIEALLPSDATESSGG